MGNFKEKIIDTQNSNFEDWIQKRQLELEEFLKVSREAGDIDISKLKRVITDFPVNFSFIISEKAIFKKKLKEVDSLCQEKIAVYTGKALEDNKFKPSDAKYKQENWLKANTDIGVYFDQVDRYQAVVDYLEDCILLFRKMPIFEFNALLQLEQKLS